MKKLNRICWLLLGAVMFAGCQSQMIALEKGDMTAKSAVPCHVLAVEKSREYGGFLDLLLSAFTSDFESEMIESIINDNLSHARDDNAMPVIVSVKERREDANGTLASLNNILGFCTLTIWPYVSSKRITYDVQLDTPLGMRSQSVSLLERSWFSILPLGLIPVPGLADERKIGLSKDFSVFRIQSIANGAISLCDALYKDVDCYRNDPAKYNGKAELLAKRAEVVRINRAFGEEKRDLILKASPAVLSDVGYCSEMILRADDIKDPVVLNLMLRDERARRLVSESDLAKLKKRLEAANVKLPSEVK